ncbi:hypothetical protein ACLKA7_010501 [Drosophila subpalustris]
MFVTEIEEPKCNSNSKSSIFSVVLANAYKQSCRGINNANGNDAKCGLEMAATRMNWLTGTALEWNEASTWHPVEHHIGDHGNAMRVAPAPSSPPFCILHLILLRLIIIISDVLALILVFVYVVSISSLS